MYIDLVLVITTFKVFYMREFNILWEVFYLWTQLVHKKAGIFCDFISITVLVISKLWTVRVFWVDSRPGGVLFFFSSFISRKKKEEEEESLRNWIIRGHKSSTKNTRKIYILAKSHFLIKHQLYQKTTNYEIW